MDFSLLQVVTLIWALATIGFVIVMILRGLATLKEDDQLFLDPAEAHLEREQRDLRERRELLTPYAKTMGIASAVLLIVVGGVWSYQWIMTPLR